ncbi:MAG TPA: ABC transporter permease, partial [Bryobacteraceae bacterium]|nr:ABC transporter permease [Bryobacteraceae bacterium]
VMRQLRNWLRRKDLERDLDRELEYDFERRVNDFIRSGMTNAEARRQATLALGGLTQIREEVRDVWLTRWLRDCTYDLRFAVRSFFRSPSFTAMVVLSLALGIGATTAVYSLVDQVVLRPLPVHEPERLVLVDWNGEQLANGMGTVNLMSYPICRDLQLQDRFFDGVLCRYATTVNLSTGGGPKPVSAEIVSGSYFTVLGVGPALGRVFGDHDDGPANANPVVVLSHQYWTTQLAGALDVVGRKVLVNAHPMTVIGVAAAGFQGVDVGEVPSLWIPASMTAQAIPGSNSLITDRRSRWMQVLGRLRPHLTLAQVQAGLQPWFKGMLEEDTRREGFPRVSPESRARFMASTIELTPAPQGHSFLRRQISQPLLVLFAATAVLLGLACLNVAGLFLARSSAREREIKTRAALGASRGRLGRQLLVDSLVFAFTGGLAGLMLAPFALRVLIAFVPADAAATNLQSSLDSRVLLFTFAVSLAVGVLSGMAPALQSGRRSLISSLKERGGTAFHGARVRKAILTVQIAFTLVLLIGAALFVRSLTDLSQKGPGFETSSLVSFGIDPLRNGYTTADASRLVSRLNKAILDLPTTESSAIAQHQLLSVRIGNNFMTIQGNERIATERMVYLNSVSPGFFSTLRVRIVAGRDLDERDARKSGEMGARSALINEAFARRYFGESSPLGARIGIGNGPDAQPNIEIVGVVADFSYRDLRGDSEQAFFPILEGAATGRNFYVRVRGTRDSAMQSVRTAIQRVDPQLPITYFRTLDDQVKRSLSTERMLATVSAGFGTLALLLSLIGLYGVMAFVVTQRTREIGIRLALGATRGSALWLVLREAIMIIAVGTIIALPCIWGLARMLEPQLFGVKPTDANTMIVAMLVLMFAGCGAALIPAYGASGIDPTEALRFE